MKFRLKIIFQLQNKIKKILIIKKAIFNFEIDNIYILFFYCIMKYSKSLIQYIFIYYKDKLLYICIYFYLL
jgi:hypothetical protein